MSLGLSIGRTVSLGLRSLLQHRLRAALTMLGVLFGVSSVVAMLSIGAGAKWEEQQQIQQLGSTNLLMRSVKPAESSRGGGSRSQFISMYGLVDEDLERISRIPGIESVVPVRELREDVRVGEKWLAPRVLATLPSYIEATGRIVAEGRFLCEEDQFRGANVCVLGSETARQLFTFTDPLGEIVRIGADCFRVVGILVPRASTTGTQSSLNVTTSGEIFVPLRTARRWFGEITMKIRPGSREMERVELHEIIARVASLDQVEPVAEAVREVLRKYHTNNDYELVVPLELLLKARETERIFTITLAAIAGISLLVGGIGIMNVMLATVTERTREIGIRRALGAKRRHIVAQFLVECVVLSATGGFLGIGLGVVIPEFVERWGNMRTIVDPFFAVLAFGISVGVGIVFGLYPAWRASVMNPVEALRHE